MHELFPLWYRITNLVLDSLALVVENEVGAQRLQIFLVLSNREWTLVLLMKDVLDVPWEKL